MKKEKAQKIISSKVSTEAIEARRKEIEEVKDRVGLITNNVRYSLDTVQSLSSSFGGSCSSPKIVELREEFIAVIIPAIVPLLRSKLVNNEAFVALYALIQVSAQQSLRPHVR